jgi:hypothetical protein
MMSCSFCCMFLIFSLSADRRLVSVIALRTVAKMRDDRLVGVGRKGMRS